MSNQTVDKHTRLIVSEKGLLTATTPSGVNFQGTIEYAPYTSNGTTRVKVRGLFGSTIGTREIMVNGRWTKYADEVLDATEKTEWRRIIKETIKGWYNQLNDPNASIPKWVGTTGVKVPGPDFPKNASPSDWFRDQHGQIWVKQNFESENGGWSPSNRAGTGRQLEEGQDLTPVSKDEKTGVFWTNDDGAKLEIYKTSEGEYYVKVPGLSYEGNEEGKLYLDEEVFKTFKDGGDKSDPEDVNNRIDENPSQENVEDIKKEEKLPEKLSEEKLEAVKRAIRDNPPSKEMQKYIEAMKKLYPDQLADVKPITKQELESKSFEEQWAYKERLANYARQSAKGVKPDTQTSGQDIPLADPCFDNFFSEIEGAINGFFKRLAGNKLVGNLAGIAGGLTHGIGFPAQLKSTVSLVGDISKRLVGKMAGALEKKLITFVKTGLGAMTQFFFNTISNPIAALAKATGFQNAAMNPIGALFNAMGCVTSKIMDSLSKTVEDMLTNMISAVINPAVCVVDQFISGIINRVTGLMDSIIGPFVLPIEKLLNPLGSVLGVFNLTSVLRQGVSIAQKALNLFRCGKGSQKKCPPEVKYKIDAGVVPILNENAQNSFMKKAFEHGPTAIADKVLSPFGGLAGVGKSLTDFEKTVGQYEIFGTKLDDVEGTDCETGALTKCGYPKVKFFGGGGEGAMGKVILGRFMDDFDTEDLRKDIKQTASIIGVDMTYPGEGYEEAPYIHFEDSCEQGYGAYGRAIVDFNMNSPTYGQVTDIIMISEGENYPIGDPSDAFVDKILIQDPGSGYSEGDTTEDGFELVIKDGKIAEVIPNNNSYSFLPPMKILSDTGSGAILRPVMTTKQKQTKVQQQIDCVTT